MSLWLTGDHLDPHLMSRLLGQAPAYAIRKNETYVSESGEEMVASTGRWQITTGWRTDATLEELIRELLDNLPVEQTVWMSLGGIKAEVFCGLLLGSWNEEAQISPATLAMLGGRGLMLHLDIYDFDNSPGDMKLSGTPH